MFSHLFQRVHAAGCTLPFGIIPGRILQFAVVDNWITVHIYVGLFIYREAIHGIADRLFPDNPHSSV